MVITPIEIPFPYLLGFENKKRVHPTQSKQTHSPKKEEWDSSSKT